jgi:DUF4097 and DUF4098 domain-containing protein YvlB
MSKVEYLNLLKKKLEFTDESFVESLIADFEAHFESGVAEGLSEEEIISHLGDVDEIVESLEGDFVKKEHHSFSDKVTSEKVKHIVIDAKFADVVVTPSQNDKVEVLMLNKGSLLSKFTNTMVGEQKGDVFEVRVLPLFNVSSNVDMKISVTLPSTLLSSRISTSSGDVEYTGITFDGECSIKTASGDITVSDCIQKSYDVQMANGDLALINSSGDIRVKSANGDVSIKEGRGDLLDCVLASGDIEVDGIYRKVNVKTVSGDVELVLSDAEQMTISTVSGDGQLTLKDMDSIRFDFVSVSGHCRILEPAGEHKLKNRQQWVLGDGKLPCHINTVSGEFEVNMG